METGTIDEVLVQGARLKIADAVSVRPRTLAELADLTGISVQGVIKHLKRLAQLGLVEERKAPASATKARRVYVARSASVGDYSAKDLAIVKISRVARPEKRRQAKNQDLESLSADVLFQRRRVRDEVRKLGKMIDRLVEEEELLNGALESGPFTDDERLILLNLLTEETIEDGVRVLSKYYGVEDGRSIDKALAKARHSVGK
ncbi:MAG TPA: winged helix-turn-helix domain-containing protein [Nitrososphaerales archaeon]|nr:winged helix-turn-helix domain-containing protein [Nitrososphaerales archaeon]